MEQGHTITQLEAYHLTGCWRLSGRIKDLRDEGHNIITETETRNGKSYARYRLVKEEQMSFV